MMEVDDNIVGTAISRIISSLALFLQTEEAAIGVFLRCFPSSWWKGNVFLAGIKCKSVYKV